MILWLPSHSATAAGKHVDDSTLPANCSGTTDDCGSQLSVEPSEFWIWPVQFFILTWQFDTATISGQDGWSTKSCSFWKLLTVPVSFRLCRKFPESADSDCSILCIVRPYAYV